MADTWSNKLKSRYTEMSDRYFPPRQVVLRTDGKISYLNISKRLQMTVAMGALVFVSWTSYTTTKGFLHSYELEAKDKEILSVQVAYRALLSEVTDYQHKFSGISKELEENHTMMVGLARRNETQIDKAEPEGKDKLVSAEVARKEAMDTRHRLKSQLHSIEESMRELASRNYSLKGDLSSKEIDLQTALGERNAAREQKKRLENKLQALEVQLAQLNRSQEDLVRRVTDRTNEEIAEIEEIFSIAGIDPNKMLATLTEDENASGGPFIAASTKEETDLEKMDQITGIDKHLGRLQGLQHIMQSMPLAQPLDYYYISSRYGKRKDPVNKRWAVHYGLDMAASKKSPVYVTAPGKVTFVGWKGNYGRFIEVDHGNGITTRYGHLHKTLVKKGENVDYRTKIGLVGNTGRSTGAHLHYEVKVNGKNVNPYNFIKAGRNVFQG